MLAVLPTLLAIVAGVALGLGGGGRLDNVMRWRPIAWRLAVGGVVVQLLLPLLPWSGWFVVGLDILSLAALIAFGVRNIRVGGMVLIVAGLCLNLVPAVLNGGTPVSGDAMVSAGLVEQDELSSVELQGPRHLSTEDDRLSWLGDAIPLPTGQVVSLGDIVVLIGLALTISSLLRGRRVEGRRPARRAPPRQGSARRGPAPRPQPPRRAPAPRATRPPVPATRTRADTTRADTRSAAPVEQAPQRARRRGTDDQRVPYEEAIEQMGAARRGPVRRRRREPDIDLIEEIDLRDPYPGD